LTLTGAKISNEENGIDKGNLLVRAKEIEARDIEGNDDLMSVNIEGTVSRKDIYHKQKNGKEAYERYENDGAVTVEGHEREQIVRATIGNGTIEGNVSGGIHRDIKTSSEITKGVEVKPVRVEYNDERTDWGSTNKILTQNAGTIGKFLDDIGVPKLDKGITPAGQKKPEELRKSNEEFFKEITYTNVLKVEDGINKVTGNYIHGLIPTSGVNGGLMEQIPKFVLEDENKIYKIVTVVRNGNEYVTVKEIDRLDSAELKRIKDERKLFINGMNEPLEKAISNSVKQYKEVSNNGKELPDGVYETTLLYNPSRGFLWDAAEAGLGKVFNGKGASLGVMRGLETALKTNDPNQKYEARFYSQGNINGDGAFNNMVRRGEYQTMTNFLVSHTGSPSADRRFQKGTSETQERLGYTNIGSVGNILDGVTSESAGMFGNWTKGLASEMIGTNQTEKNEFIQNNFRNVPVYGDAGAVIQKYPLLEAPLFDDKKIKNTKNGNFIVFTDSEVKEIYEKQFPNGKKNISINQMRKILDSEFSQHRMYFNGDFETVQKLLDIEKKKNEKVLKPEEYQKLIDDENKIRLERQETIKNILTNIYILKPEDLVKQRNEAILPGIMDETPKNESYKNFQKQNIQLPEIPKKENSDPKELKDILNNLRKRVGN
jgi:hemolysin